MNTNQIERNIKAISRFGKKMDAFIQDTALQVALHCHKHGEISLLHKLWSAMQEFKGARHKAMDEWMIRFAPVKMVDPANIPDDKFPFTVDTERMLDEEGRNALCLEQAKPANHWYNMKPDPKLVDSLDINAMLNALLKRVDNETKKNADLKITGEDTLRKLRELVTHME
ncbi:hypothetical protein Paz_02 [Xylella phage Paz]|uniref:Uncharacterized protein n=1 Tax=Xylella phage Paz TaxID=1415145 RepID=V5Q7K1_9CAUD|nr:hypothetical protein Paz_02 [Xylella phage Paz]AHB12099.1 hypothetical protein Paz_02 [Xylella phage Paz]